MKISVEHSTIYRYNYAAYLEPHTFRLQPRMTGTQRLLAFDIQIQPSPSGSTEALDQDGNLALHAWFNGPALELNVRTRFTVELLRQNPFDYFLGGPWLQLPLWYMDPLCGALAPYRNDRHVSEAVKQYARSIAYDAGWNTLSFLAALNQRLFHASHHVTRPEGPPWASDVTLNLHQGSCRDLAVLFCDACRVMGIAARFVSGYECASAGRQDSYMHAWAEVYLPGAGWRGYDPSRGLAVANTHVAVASGFDYNLAAPITGSYSGGADAEMEALLTMHVDWNLM
jgi:transglutaminase-like putative cysteine protease